MSSPSVHEELETLRARVHALSVEVEKLKSAHASPEWKYIQKKLRRVNECCNAARNILERCEDSPTSGEDDEEELIYPVPIRYAPCIEIRATHPEVHDTFVIVFRGTLRKRDWQQRPLLRSGSIIKCKSTGTLKYVVKYVCADGVVAASPVDAMIHYLVRFGTQCSIAKL